MWASLPCHPTYLFVCQMRNKINDNEIAYTKPNTELMPNINYIQFNWLSKALIYKILKLLLYHAAAPRQSIKNNVEMLL